MTDTKHAIFSRRIQGLVAAILGIGLAYAGIEIEETRVLELAGEVLAVLGTLWAGWGQARKSKRLHWKLRPRPTEYADPLHTTVLTRDGRYPWAEDTKGQDGLPGGEA